MLASPVLVALFFTLAPTSVLAAASTPACGHANMNNPGHHYGLIKNGCLPTQSPIPAPVPVPTSHSTPKPPPVVVSDPPRTVPVGTPSAGLVAPAIPDIITVLPVSASDPQLSRSTSPSNSPAVDYNIWVVMALLLIMVVLWLVLVGRISAKALGLRMRQVPVPA